MTGRALIKYLDKIAFLLDPFSWICKVFVNPCRSFIYRIGVVLRYYSLRRMFQRCGKNVSVHKNVKILHHNRIIIGDNVSIHPMCYIDGEGGIDIGSNVSIAHNTSIMSFNHTWDRQDVPIKYNNKEYGKVEIGDDVWIGCGVRIMAGVTIGQRCVIAAGAVVTKDCEPNSLYGGVPARKIKSI